MAGVAEGKQRNELYRPISMKRILACGLTMYDGTSEGFALGSKLGDGEG